MMSIRLLPLCHLHLVAWTSYSRFTFYKSDNNFQVNFNPQLADGLYEKEYFYSREMKIVKDLKNIINKNFVLSGLNLSFLGSYAENKVKIYKELYHWPDGSFANYNYKLKKIGYFQMYHSLDKLMPVARFWSWNLLHLK